MKSKRTVVWAVADGDGRIIWKTVRPRRREAIAIHEEWWRTFKQDRECRGYTIRKYELVECAESK